MQDRRESRSTLGDYKSATADYDKAVSLGLNSATIGRADLEYQQKDYSAARADFRKAISLYNAQLQKEQNDAYALDGLVWLLATSPDSSFRDRAKVVSRLRQLSNWQEKNTLDTIAATYAENGQFAPAVTWQQKALGSPSSQRHARAPRPLQAPSAIPRGIDFLVGGRRFHDHAGEARRLMAVGHRHRQCHHVGAGGRVCVEYLHRR